MTNTNAYPPAPRCPSCDGPLGAEGPLVGGVMLVTCAVCGSRYRLSVVDGDIVWEVR